MIDLNNIDWFYVLSIIYLIIVGMGSVIYISNIELNYLRQKITY